MGSITSRSKWTTSRNAVAFYHDVFDLEKLDEGEGDAFFKAGEHQFLCDVREAAKRSRIVHGTSD